MQVRSFDKAADFASFVTTASRLQGETLVCSGHADMHEWSAARLEDCHDCLYMVATWLQFPSSGSSPCVGMSKSSTMSHRPFRQQQGGAFSGVDRGRGCKDDLDRCMFALVTLTREAGTSHVQAAKVGAGTVLARDGPRTLAKDPLSAILVVKLVCVPAAVQRRTIPCNLL